MVDPQLVRNSPVLYRKKLENAKITAVIVDVFWYLVVGLCEINHAAVSVPPVDEIVNDCVLVAFTNQVIEDNNLLVVHRKLFKGDYLIPRCLDDLVASLGVDYSGKNLAALPGIYFDEHFLKTGVNLFVNKQPVKHVQQDVCFSGVDGAANQHPKNIS